MKSALIDQVLIFELKKENAEIILRKREYCTTITVKNWDGSYEIGTYVNNGIHFCRVIQAIRLMIMGARECNWRKYEPVVREILEMDN